MVLSPLQGCVMAACDPGLAPLAAFLRRCAAAHRDPACSSVVLEYDTSS